MLVANIVFKSSEFVGTDYLKRDIFLVKGEISLENNKPFTKHIMFYEGDRFNFMPLYEDIQRVNMQELNDFSCQQQISNLFEDYYTFTMSKGAVDIIMINESEFVSKTTVHDLPINEAISINVKEEFSGS